uniref:Tyrosine-protein kinase n=1 Tax=Caenorhabditis japonica TaxID=281687 RepID=A0A8R1DRQ1_CAEJA
MARKDGDDAESDHKTEMKTNGEKKMPKMSCRTRSKEPGMNRSFAERRIVDIGKSRLGITMMEKTCINKSAGRQMRTQKSVVGAGSPDASNMNSAMQDNMLKKSTSHSNLVGNKERDPKETCTTFNDSFLLNPPAIPIKDFSALEEHVVKMPNFHGYVDRDDLTVILTKNGDWLVRMSIHPDKDRKKKRTVRETASKEKCRKEKCVGKSVVISVYSTEKVVTTTPIRNLVVKLIDGKVSVDPAKQFKSLPELIQHYQKNCGSYKDGDYMLLKPIPLSSWEFQHDEIELSDRKLGEGAFGDVRVGRLKTKKVDVAVKMLKNAITESTTRDQVIELLHEARMMRILDHPNVLRTYGIAVLEEPQYLMSELCSCGALREYLKEHHATITMAEKLNFVLGSARGVEYLHSQKMIHRDLAVRNILLTEDKTPKVSDFGLAKISERYEMTEQCKIPVRYLSPETLEHFIFTPKTDVFSFGCVIWEIYENGQQPHDGKNGPTIRALIRKREFLKLSAAAPEELRKFVVDKVFVSDPENRCTMTTIVQAVEKIEKGVK